VRSAKRGGQGIDIPFGTSETPSTPLGDEDPWADPERRAMVEVLVVPTLELCHPIVARVAVNAGYRSVHF
jgi:hypothetical protein